MTKLELHFMTLILIDHDSLTNLMLMSVLRWGLFITADIVCSIFIFIKVSISAVSLIWYKSTYKDLCLLELLGPFQLLQVFYLQQLNFFFLLIFLCSINEADIIVLVFYSSILLHFYVFYLMFVYDCCLITSVNISMLHKL